jgi:hypothetical protein
MCRQKSFGKTEERSGSDERGIAESFPSGMSVITF